MRSRVAATACLSFFIGALTAGVAHAAGAPDLILYHGHVLTVDAQDSQAEALAIGGGKILAVGSDADILRLAASATRRIDLAGRTATPGLIDSHAHIAEGGLDALYHVDLGDASSVSEVVARVAKRLATLKPGEWLQGDGWDEGKLAEKRYVLAADLDPVSPHNPLWLVHTTGHYGVANSAALKLAKITASSKDPAAGTIDRNADGAPSGVLKESAMALVGDLIPPPTPQQQRAAILKSIEELHREGMTAVKDPDVSQAMWDAYRELLRSGRLNERVCVLWHAGSTLEGARQALAAIQKLPRPPQSLGDGRLLSCGAKIFLDGSGGARTAWVSQEWHKNSTDIDRGNFGYPTTDPEVYRQMVRLLHQAGVSVGTHAIGDRAIDWAVDTYAEVLRETPTQGLRHSIIHANIPSEHAIRTMAELEQRYDAGYPEVQAPFLWWIGDTYAANFGPVRAARLVPLASFAKNGIRWGGGSDYPVTPLPARYGLWASLERETLKGGSGLHPFGRAEAVDIHIALRSYTGWGASQLFLEQRIGSLEKGKEADIAVWEQDMYEMPSAELRNLRCSMTLLHGQVVFDSSRP